MAAPSNRFAKVDTPDSSAVTVTIREADGRATGQVEGPARAGASGAPSFSLGQDGSLSAEQALAAGCHLANELGVTVVIIDADGSWRPVWGQLDIG